MVYDPIFAAVGAGCFVGKPQGLTAFFHMMFVLTGVRRIAFVLHTAWMGC
jgi:hypothetical protein